MGMFAESFAKELNGFVWVLPKNLEDFGRNLPSAQEKALFVVAEVSCRPEHELLGWQNFAVLKLAEVAVSYSQLWCELFDSQAGFAPEITEDFAKGHRSILCRVD